MSKNTKFLYHVPKNATPIDYQHAENVVTAAAKIFKKLIEYYEVICLAQMQS